MNEHCQKCGGKCCVGEIKIHKKDELFNDRFLTDHFDDAYRVMKTKYNGDCICLINGRCAIYEKRPIECKLFVEGSNCCEEFKTGKKKKHDCAVCHITQLAKEG